ncbi:GL23740 [Drosophila persimilis]|uniref:GL23740 n=1 Tax=Drosophila persimilis TaxID=7234 RepID=B4G618_DROPE|nr:GL23740 [Drosophila persimilis]
MAANDERQEQVCCCCGCCCSGSNAAAVIALGNAASAPQPHPQVEVFQWIGLETAELLPAYVTRYYNSLHHQMTTKRVNEANQDSFTVDHYCGGGGGGDTQGPGSAAGGGGAVGGAAGACPGAGAGAAAGGCPSTAGQWSGGGGGGVTASTGGCGIGMCQHHGLTSQSLMSGGSHILLLDSSVSSVMSGSGVGSSGQEIPQCSAAAADAAMMRRATAAA